MMNQFAHEQAVPAFPVPTDGLVVPGGEDTAHISFYCRFTDRFFQLLDELRHAQAIAKNPPQASSPDEEPPQPVVTVGEHVYVVRPSGYAPDKGNSRYCYYEFVMQEGGIVFAIQPREYKASGEGKDAARPNIRVECGALPLILAGSLDVLMPEVERRLNDFGLIVIKNRLARVDACVDIPRRIRPLQAALFESRFVTRARTVAAHSRPEYNDYGISMPKKSNVPNIIPSDFDGEDDKEAVYLRGHRYSGFAIGRDKVMCRVYDKLAKEKHREDMLEMLRIRRFGADAELPPNLTRVEFQLRREALRGMSVERETTGIETWQDWCKYKSAIVWYLCTKWLVFYGADFDRTHSSRLTEEDWHPDWKEAVHAFKRTYGEEGKPAIRLIPSIKREARAAIAQSVGNDQSAMMRTGCFLSPKDPDWIEKLASFRYYATFRYLEDPDTQAAFWDNWRDKELRQEASVPDDLLSTILPVANREAGVTHKQPLPQLYRALTDGAGYAPASPDAIS